LTKPKGPVDDTGVDTSKLGRDLKTWVIEAVNLLQGTTPPMQTKRRLIVDKSDNIIHVQTEGQEPVIWAWLDQYRIPLSSLPTADGVALAIKNIADSNFQKTVIQTRRDADLDNPGYVFDQFLQPILAEHLYASHLARPVEDDIKTWCGYIADFVSHPLTLFHPTTVILRNVTLGKPIELEPGIVINRLTGLAQRRMFFDDSPAVPMSPIYPNASGPSGEDSRTGSIVTMEISADHFARAQMIAETFVLACRIYGMESVGYDHIRQQPHNPIRQLSKSSLSPILGGTHLTGVWSLDGDEGKRVTKHWESIRKMESNPRFQLAIRRFGAANQRSTFDDQLIDLWIALEAIFAGPGKSEVTYKVSTRMARLLGNSLEERSGLHRRYSKAYDLRSRIVHGSTEELKRRDSNLIVEECFELRKDLKTIFKLAIENGWRPEYPAMDLMDDDPKDWAAGDEHLQ
jgi:hypothetical protein